MLRFDADGWLGDNTDGVGLVRDIERNAGVALRGARVLLIGAGGAAAGVLGPLLDARPRRSSWSPTARRPRRSALVAAPSPALARAHGVRARGRAARRRAAPASTSSSTPRASSLHGAARAGRRPACCGPARWRST